MWGEAEASAVEEANRVVNEPRGITPIAEGTNRLSAGQAIRLHLVSGDPPDPKKPHLRLGGRIGWVAPATVGGTGQAIPLAELGEWHRVRWVALGDVFQEP